VLFCFAFSRRHAAGRDPPHARDPRILESIRSKLRRHSTSACALPNQRFLPLLMSHSHPPAPPASRAKRSRSLVTESVSSARLRSVISRKCRASVRGRRWLRSRTCSRYQPPNCPVRPHDAKLCRVQFPVLPCINERFRDLLSVIGMYVTDELLYASGVCVGGNSEDRLQVAEPTSRPLLTSESQPTDALASIARPSLSLASERACSARFVRQYRC